MKTHNPQPTHSSRAILAISGGVDSICLLKLSLDYLNRASTTSRLARHFNQFAAEFALADCVVVYCNHNQRSEAQIQKDIRAIQNLIEREQAANPHQKIKFKVVDLDLPLGASESLARTARYKKLEEVRRQEKADFIFTAHHCDDVVETACINLTRGTGIRGLCALKFKRGQVVRPFLFGLNQRGGGNQVFKEELLAFAKLHNLAWHEDSTNLESKFLRNRLRAKLKLAPHSQKLQLLNLSLAADSILIKLDLELDQLLSLILQNNILDRTLLGSLDPEIQAYLLHTIFRKFNLEVDQATILSLSNFLATKPKGKLYQAKGLHFKNITANQTLLVLA